MVFPRFPDQFQYYTFEIQDSDVRLPFLGSYFLADR